MSVIIDRKDPIDEDDGWLLLERQTINDRTLLCWYNPNIDQISISLFNLLEQPNQLSQMSTESQWGYMTHYIQDIKSDREATELVNLYLEDLNKENYWWESIPNN